MMINSSQLYLLFNLTQLSYKELLKLYETGCFEDNETEGKISILLGNLDLVVNELDRLLQED